MSTVVKVDEVLTRLEVLSKKVDEHNRKEDEVRGFKKARIQSILAEVAKLEAKGIDVGLELDGETSFTKESLDNFRKVAQGIIANHMKEADKLDGFFKAVESGDVDKIKKITGEDVDTVDYNVELGSLKEMREQVAETNEEILASGITSITNDKKVLTFDEDKEESAKVVEEPTKPAESSVGVSSADEAKGLADAFGLEIDEDDLEPEKAEEVAEEPAGESYDDDLSDLSDWNF